MSRTAHQAALAQATSTAERLHAPQDEFPHLQQFPVSIGATEPFILYSHECQSRMRQWVITALREHGIETPEEQDAVLLCEDRATKYIGRGLHAVESKLLGDCVRDVLFARETLRARREWLEEFQSSHVGEIAS